MAAVRSLAIAHNGGLLASSDDSGEVFVWELKSGKRSRLEKEKKAVYALEFDRKSERIAVGSEQTIKIYTLGNMKLEMKMSGH